LTKWILLLIAFGAALTATVRVNYLFDRITDEINKVDPKDRIPVFGGSKHDLYRDLGRHKRLFAESDLRRRFYRWIGMVFVLSLLMILCFVLTDKKFQPLTPVNALDRFTRSACGHETIPAEMDVTFALVL